MYRLSVPLMSKTVTVENRDAYLRLCREAGATRVFLCNGSPNEPIPASLGENVAFFKKNGFAVGIWTDTIGHGFVLKHAKPENPRFQQMVGLDGVERVQANCPMDPAFRRHIADYIAALAATGADIVMLDDDYRMSQHGPSLYCACPAHLARIGEILGEAVTIDTLRPYVLSGKRNRYRDAWMQAQSEGLLETAREIRRAVDAVDPGVTVCSCVAYAPFNVDGVDVEALSRILAGKNPPILRLTGAPYWAAKRPRNFTLISVFEIARMLAAYFEGKGIELMCEGDVYPRPRYTCPASYLELYDAATRIDGGYDGILKYMFDYIAGPGLETGYLQMHRRSAEMLEETIPALFPNGANAGVRVVTEMHTMRDADLDLSSLSKYSPLPQDGAMLGHCGIPTLYRGEGVCNSVFGENARHYDLAELSKGTMLDAVSAVILTERGIDVGLSAYGALMERDVAFLSTEDPEYKSFISEGTVRAFTPTLAKEAKPILFAYGTEEGVPFAYTYENASGERFLVFLFEGDSLQRQETLTGSGIIRNDATRRALFDALPWVARAPLPAVCGGNPDLYLMCGREEGAMSVALLNTFADPMVGRMILLDEAYDEIECFGCTAELRGRLVTVTSDLPAYAMAAFRVYRKPSEKV